MLALFLVTITIVIARFKKYDLQKFVVKTSRWLFAGGSVEPGTTPITAEVATENKRELIQSLISPPEPPRVPTADVTLVYTASEPMAADAYTKGPASMVDKSITAAASTPESIEAIDKERIHAAEKALHDHPPAVSYH